MKKLGLIAACAALPAAAAAQDGHWGYYEPGDGTMHDHNVRAMDRFGDKLAEAEKLDVILKPFRKAPVQLSFDVTGAKGAIERVYKACGDEAKFG